jgi:hypothetical protein
MEKNVISDKRLSEGVKHILFQRRSFCFILIILLFAVCVYPPFRVMEEGGMIGERKWDCIFTTLPTPYEVPEIDLAMLSVEATAAIPLAMGISLMFSAIQTALRGKDEEWNLGNSVGNGAAFH